MITVAMAIRMGKPLLLQSQDRSNDLPFVLRSHRVVIDRPNDVDIVNKYLDLSLRETVSERESARSCAKCFTVPNCFVIMSFRPEIIFSEPSRQKLDRPSPGLRLNGAMTAS